MKIAILDTNSFQNKGSVGRLEGLINCLNKTIPDSQITLFHRYFEKDEIEIEKKLLKFYPEIKIKKHPWFNEKGSNSSTALIFILKTVYKSISYFFSSKLNLKNEFYEYDVLVDLNLIEPDILSDKVDMKDLIGAYFVYSSIFISSLIKKPFNVCSATVGPYKSNLLKKFAKFSLNRANLITFRENYSYEYAKNVLEIKKPMILTADLAFLMETPEKSETINSLQFEKKDKITVGICPTAMMNSNLPKTEYLNLLSDLKDFLALEFEANILLIANTYQDIPIVNELYEFIEEKDNCEIIPFDLSASETKGIIKTCDLFICSRFHALVASTSLKVPSLGLVAYSYNKFHGILGQMMQIDNYLLNIDDNFDKNAFSDLLKSKVNELIMNEDSMKNHLKEREKIVKDKVYLNGTLIKEFIQKAD